MCRYETVRRALVHRVLRVSIAIAVAIAAVTAGLLTSLAAPAAVAVVVGVTAAVGGQAIRGRLEHAADRWVLGSRLAGYANLNRFGRSLIQAPGSAELLSDLAGEVRRGLGLTWARISLDAADGPPRMVTDGTPGGEPGATVSIEYRGTILGRIECGPCSDGPLLAENRRLLAYFAAQAAVGVYNLHLAAELAPAPRARPGPGGRTGGVPRARGGGTGRRAPPDSAEPARRGPAGDRGAVGQGRAGAPATAAG